MFVTLLTYTLRSTIYTELNVYSSTYFPDKHKNNEEKLICMYARLQAKLRYMDSTNRYK